MDNYYSKMNSGMNDMVSMAIQEGFPHSGTGVWITGGVVLITIP